ncbi:MAG TPA: hypothetical protein VGP24_05400, partial [Glaciihabitans sp.]|nr:hypothetical protein [Glaciihabitans sp.]
MSPSSHSRSAARKKKAVWLDPRFAIGVFLVFISVAGVVSIVAAADSSISVMAAREPIVPGQTVTAADVIPTQVNVGSAAELYVVDTDIPEGGLVATRSIAAGELVPLSAMGTLDGLQLTALVLTLESRLPESVTVGSRVDIWSSSEIGSGTFEAPTVVVPGAIVVRLVEDDSLV